MKQNERPPAPSPGNDRVFLTPKQLADRWQCSTEKLKRMRRAGVLRVKYIGRSARYRLADILHIENQDAV